uniref:ArgK/MeaB family GTPase n=1 Tax=Actinosynnema sp. TaxID=1872144 RepID=UPI003F85D33F
VIVPEEIELLHGRGVTRIFSPADGQELGLARMINLMVRECDHDLADPARVDRSALRTGSPDALAATITLAEAGRLPGDLRAELEAAASARRVPVLGITGTGGSGKSSLTDELVRRFRLDQQDKLRIAVLAVDPTRRRGGGALLGDRIRMNCLEGDRVFFRSLATRRAGSEVPDGLADAILACKAAGFDLVVVETPGIGQGDAAIVPFVDRSLYVMTPEFGAASQLEKIDMLDYADAVAINKFERRGADDARRDVARQLVRNREAFGASWEDMPVYGTSAATFNDDGVTALYQHLRDGLAEHGLQVDEGALPPVSGRVSTAAATVVPASRSRYLAEIAETVRGYRRATETQVDAVRRVAHLEAARAELVAAGHDADALDELLAGARRRVDGAAAELLETWPSVVADYSGDELVVRVRDRELRTALTRTTLSGNRVRRVALPRHDEPGALLRFLRAENLPGRFPFTAGVFPFKREGEDPARMFAGEGDAFRTNRRFKYLSQGSAATRLSTAFDSVTLYGRDPD